MASRRPPGIGGDKLARKGIVGVRLKKNGRSVAVFTTHLQAGGKKDPTVKADQLRELNEFRRKFVGDRQNEIDILAGDFNIRSTDDAEYRDLQATRRRPRHLPGNHRRPQVNDPQR